MSLTNTSSTGAPFISDEYYRWIVLLYGVVLQAISVGTIIYCFTLFTLPWLDEFGSSRRDMMLTIALLQIGAGILGPDCRTSTGHLSATMGHSHRSGLVSVGARLAQRVTALWQLWLIYATLLPVTMTLMGTLASQTLVSRWFTDNRGFALGISAIGTNVGGIILPIFVSAWLLQVGWRGTMNNLLILSIAVVLPLTLLIPQKITQRIKTNSRWITLISGSGQRKRFYPHPCSGSPFGVWRR